jgi:hypothetical protein
MGLDIRAYSRLTYVGHHEEWTDEDAHYEQHHEAYSYDEFPHALMGLPDIRRSESVAQFITAGCFAETAETESHGFRAGSYSGYGAWRRDLADRFNPYRENGQPSPEGPFYELIWFADNEGTIAQLAAVNLLAAFRQHEVEYRAAHADAGQGDWFVAKYADWMRACELAADDGLIDFH